MRCFKLIISASASAVIAMITPALADTCCPMNFHLDFNPLQCISNGVPQTTAASFTCGAQPPPPPAGSGSTGNYVGGNFQPACTSLNVTKPARDKATLQCLSDLSENAVLAGCWIDDIKEDQRTGLSCPARQQLLASQCRKQCEVFAEKQDTCHSPDQTWQAAFGDLSGLYYSSARYDLCGPQIPTGLAVIKRPKKPFKRVTP